MLAADLAKSSRRVRPASSERTRQSRQAKPNLLSSGMTPLSSSGGRSLRDSQARCRNGPNRSTVFVVSARDFALEVEEDASLLALGLKRDRDEPLPVQAVVAVERRDRVVQPVDHVLKVGLGADRIAVAVGDQVGLGREARRMAGRAAGGRVVHVGGADVDVSFAGDLREPGVADVHDVVHPGLDRLRRLIVGGHGQHPRAQDVVGMVGVDLEVVGPAGERAADVLGVPLALAVVDDLHRVLAREIGLGPAALGVDRVDPEIGRDVAVEQIELEVNQDRLLVGDLEPEPVEARFPFVGVFEVVDVVGRAVDVAAEP